MRVKTIVEEDFVNYKKPSMFVGTISCNGKCCLEANIPLSVCQNDVWRTCAIHHIPDRELCKRYLSNPITEAIVFGGLEPFEQTDELLDLVKMLREDFKCTDDVVIYTGYDMQEILPAIEMLQQYPNIIVKFGRYIPDKPSHFDFVLGVHLASPNQYATKIS